MANFCDCDSGLGNTGLTGCIPFAGVPHSLIIVPTFKSDGTYNEIDEGDTLDAAYFTNKVNAGSSGATITDSLEKWLPLPQLFDIEDVRADSQFETLNGDKNFFVKKGTRTFTGMIPNTAATFLKQIDSYKCNSISTYIRDLNGNLIGNGSTSGKLRPFKIDNETWDTNLMKASASASTTQKLSLTFSYDDSEFDGDIKIIQPDQMSINITDLTGILDVNATAAASISTTGFSTELSYIYGAAFAPNKFKGAVLADFDLYNETTTATVVITSVTENPDGTYTFVIPAQTSADVLTLNLQKDGFEMTALSITIP